MSPSASGSGGAIVGLGKIMDAAASSNKQRSRRVVTCHDRRGGHVSADRLMMRFTMSALQCLTLALLVIPPLLAAIYIIASFPHPPAPLTILPSLTSLPIAWSIYPDNYYAGGAYAPLPFGKACSLLVSMSLRADALSRSGIGYLVQRKAGKSVFTMPLGYLARSDTSHPGYPHQRSIHTCHNLARCRADSCYQRLPCSALW